MKRSKARKSSLDTEGKLNALKDQEKLKGKTEK
jgi:hypothetical protein